MVNNQPGFLSFAKSTVIFFCWIDLEQGDYLTLATFIYQEPSYSGLWLLRLIRNVCNVIDSIPVL